LNYAIRQATEGDWDAIDALFAMEHVRTHMHAPTREQYFASLSRDGCLNFVIEREGRFFGNMRIDLPENWLMVIGALAVCEPRKGAGRFALGYAIDLAFEELSIHRIFVEIVETNVASQKLCESVGFQPEGLYRDGYRDDAGTYHNLIPYGMLRTTLPPASPP
jgi:RimJ/RimL family protein N-acetyltransferase